MKNRRSNNVRYFERENYALRDGIVIERNGSLNYIEDTETGKRDWYDDFEINERKGRP